MDKVDKIKFLSQKGVEYSLELTKKATKWELEFRDKLLKVGEDFIFQHPVLCAMVKT